MKLYRVPALAQRLLPGFTWQRPTSERVIYLTFDDGPIPEVSQFVLGQLANFNAKATFFCVGDNVHKHPRIAELAQAAGHRLANHTYHHLNGWKTPHRQYLDNVQACQQALEKVTGPAAAEKPLFRPPYGKITRSQAASLRPFYELVMWDVLSYDFDAQVTPAEVLQQTIRNSHPGAVVLFHDSLKAYPNMRYALPRFLEHFSALNYTFATL